MVLQWKCLWNQYFILTVFYLINLCLSEANFTCEVFMFYYFFENFVQHILIIFTLLPSTLRCNHFSSHTTLYLKKKIDSNLCCLYTFLCLAFHWSVANLLGATMDYSWRKLIVSILAAINSQYLLSYGWEFMPTSLLHAEIFVWLELAYVLWMLS